MRKQSVTKKIYSNTDYASAVQHLRQKVCQVNLVVVSLMFLGWVKSAVTSLSSHNLQDNRFLKMGRFIQCISNQKNSIKVPLCKRLEILFWKWQPIQYAVVWRFNIAIWWFVWLNWIDAICYAMLLCWYCLKCSICNRTMYYILGFEFESILLFVFSNPLFDWKFINLRITWSFITFPIELSIEMTNETYIVHSYHDVFINKLISMVLGVYQHLLSI